MTKLLLRLLKTKRMKVHPPPPLLKVQMSQKNKTKVVNVKKVRYLLIKNKKGEKDTIKSWLGEEALMKIWSKYKMSQSVTL